MSSANVDEALLSKYNVKMGDQALAQVRTEKFEDWSLAEVKYSLSMGPWDLARRDLVTFRSLLK